MRAQRRAANPAWKGCREGFLGKETFNWDQKSELGVGRAERRARRISSSENSASEDKERGGERREVRERGKEKERVCKWKYKCA